MSGGISAIKGFDYQAVVILSRLFDHFDRHGASALARPEGSDDLDLIWEADGVEHRRYEQIKKPAEDKAGKLNPTPWTLARAIEKLLPNTVAHLSGNDYSQVWIVGDTIHHELESLIAAGANAPSIAGQAYWMVAHGLTRNKATRAADLPQSLRQKLARWRLPAGLPSDPAEALSRLTVEFGCYAEASGTADAATHYREKIAELHACLPDVLGRIQILASYGSEKDVAKTVIDRLEQTYSLQRSAIENCLFRNLTGFINDIEKQPGRRFDREEFQFELRSVWPQMLPIRDAPALSANHIARRDLVEPFTTGWTGKAVETVGISGSGKTMLAAEVVEHSRHVDPARRVFYAEVRGEVSLRDVLVGVAFHLRRLGITEPFVVSVQCGPAEEEALARLARVYSALSQEVSLLVDLVDGTCNLAFARDLATFIRALSPSAFRIGVLGQESGLRELTAAERQDHGVMRLDLRGFRFEEFVLLVGHHHAKADRAVLWDIYQRVTAGRPAGLFAKLADSLARAPSLEEMSAMAARPADKILAHAEQQRFARISVGARSAAEKLVCFALPFRLRDAEEVFPDDNVGAAIRELLTQGLLRGHAEDSFEMHETVRAGLEEMIAPNVRRTAHVALAAWYRARAITTAEILHLERAGRSDEAQRVAREVFLRGERWAALAAYVTAHKLVSAGELVSTLAGPNPVQDQYLFSSLLREIGGPPPVNELFEVLRAQPQRFVADYHWGLAIVEAILDFEPERLHDLIVFALEVANDGMQRESALNWLLIAARRKNGVIGSRTTQLFGGQPPEMKRLLLRFLLLGRRRETMRPAFQFLADDPGPAEGPQRHWHDLALQIGNRDDTVEFLAAMPAVETVAMLTARSALLGPLAGLVWAQRRGLRSYCIEILRDSTAEEAVLVNAMRVLVFLGEPSIFALCGPLMTRSDRIGSFAKLMPALLPSSCDCALYEARLLDCGVSLEDRMAALFVLAAAGAELGSLYTRVRAAETDPKKAEAWEFNFLMLCAQAPFPEAIPLLETRLAAADAQAANLLISALMKLGELPVPSATVMLTRALSHTQPRVRQCAAIGLTQRRSRAALPSLIDRYANEDIEVLAVGLATAIVASGPKSMADLPSGRHDSPATQLWRCILAMRLRNAAFADVLVALANDPSQNWQLRRAAIFAAGRLPYEAALERLAPIVLAERSPLTIDGSMGFLCHAVLSSTLLCGAEAMAPIFARGRAGFIEFFAELFEGSWKDTFSFSRQGLPTGVAAADWLFDRLGYHGWPTRRGAPDAVLNEISTPMLHSAVLRSFRLSGRPDLIEEQLPTAYHSWFAMKCLLERSRAGARDPELADRLKSLVDASPCKGDARLHRVIAEFGGVPPAPPPPPARPPVGADQAGGAPPVTCVGYDEVARVLSGADADFKPAGALVLKSLDAEQCERLIRMADPVNDPDRGVETYVPSVEFTQNGHIVARRRVTYAGGGETIHALLRPAVAVANSFGLPNPWHEELLTGPLSATYVPNYLTCLAATDDGGKFYEELGRHAEILMPLLCDAQRAKPVLKYVDGRIAPFLMRHVSSGTDELFEGLCTLALRIDAPEIDSVLAGLLFRFTRRFDVRAAVLQHSDNHALWRGFNRLAEHPRFILIKGWTSRLASVLQAPMVWFRAENIVRVLERDPRSYILIESRLFKAGNWEHFHWDEVDRLDEAGEKLFYELLEP